MKKFNIIFSRGCRVLFVRNNNTDFRCFKSLILIEEEAHTLCGIPSDPRTTGPPSRITRQFIGFEKSSLQTRGDHASERRPTVPRFGSIDQTLEIRPFLAPVPSVCTRQEGTRRNFRQSRGKLLSVNNVFSRVQRVRNSIIGPFSHHLALPVHRDYQANDVRKSRRFPWPFSRYL